MEAEEARDSPGTDRRGRDSDFPGRPVRRTRTGRGAPRRGGPRARAPAAASSRCRGRRGSSGPRGDPRGRRPRRTRSAAARAAGRQKGRARRRVPLTGRSGRPAIPTSGLEAGHHPEDREAVDARAPEVDLRGLVEVARHDRDLADAHVLPHARGDDLRVEDEVVREGLEVDALEIVARIGAQARVVLGEVEIERGVLDGGEEDVREVLPLRHAALERAPAEHAAAEHRVLVAARDRADEVGQDGRVVLVVRVHHDADVGAARERRRVAGLLVAAVAAVLRVRHDVDSREARARPRPCGPSRRRPRG